VCEKATIKHVRQVPQNQGCPRAVNKSPKDVTSCRFIPHPEFKPAGSEF